MIDLETMSILVVDDMKSMRLTIRKMLQNLGIGKTLRFAENGKEGLAILNTTPCDLAIVDWNMPIMNGTQMLLSMRKDKVLRDIPVIILTAENKRDVVSEVAEIEIDAYLLKPLTLESLDRKIKAVVDNANHPDDATLHLLKARALEEAEDFEGAIEQTRLALFYKPSASRILRKMGLLHFKIDKPGVGEKCLLKAVSVNNQDIASRKLLVSFYLEKKEFDKAAGICLEILGLSTRYVEEAMDLGEKLMNHGYKPRAIELFSRLASRYWKNNELKERIIDICLENQAYDYLKKLLDQSIRENPANWDLVYKAGLVCQEMGDHERAMESFKMVDLHEKSHVESKLQIARLYHAQGKIFQADVFLNQILRIDPKNQEALLLRSQL